MKAHRRIAKNTALVECVQVVAEKTSWPLSDAARRASSLTGGGGARAEIPATPIDEAGRIGRPETRGSRPTQVLPAGTMRIAMTKQPRDGGGTRGPRAAGGGTALRAVIALRRRPRLPTPRLRHPPQPMRRHRRPPPRRLQRLLAAPPAQTQHGAVRFSSVFGTRRR